MEDLIKKAKKIKEAYESRRNERVESMMNLKRVGLSIYKIGDIYGISGNGVKKLLKGIPEYEEFKWKRSKLPKVTPRKSFKIGMGLTKKKDFEEGALHNGGYLYIVESNGLYKIGITSNLHRRLKSFKTSNPFPFILIYSVKLDEPRKCEKELHRKFDGKKVSGEWFSINPTDIDLTKSLIESKYKII